MTTKDMIRDLSDASNPSDQKAWQIMRLAAMRLEQLQLALELIAHFDEQPVWTDDRDDAAEGMLEAARTASNFK